VRYGRWCKRRWPKVELVSCDRRNIVSEYRVNWFSWRADYNWTEALWQRWCCRSGPRPNGLQRQAADWRGFRRRRSDVSARFRKKSGLVAGGRCRKAAGDGAGGHPLAIRVDTVGAGAAADAAIEVLQDGCFGRWGHVGSSASPTGPGRVSGPVVDADAPVPNGRRGHCGAGGARRRARVGLPHGTVSYRQRLRGSSMAVGLSRCLNPPTVPHTPSAFFGFLGFDKGLTASNPERRRRESRNVFATESCVSASGVLML